MTSDSSQFLLHLKCTIDQLLKGKQKQKINKQKKRKEAHSSAHFLNQVKPFFENNVTYAYLASRNTGIPCRLAFHNGVQQGESKKYLQKVCVLVKLLGNSFSN